MRRRIKFEMTEETDDMAAKKSPETRAPAGHGRSAVEGGGATVVLAYIVSQHFPDLPLEVQLAIVGFGVQAISNAMAVLRNRGLGGFFAGAAK